MGSPEREINRGFVDWEPNAINGSRIFDGEWISAVPGLPTGKAPLFEDARVLWFEERLGGFSGHNVLELGSLEGGHTYMMTRRGATVLAIESNVRAWLRCLVVKEAVGISGATFLLGDFNKFLGSNRGFTFALASGVLYHQPDPVGFLEKLCQSAPLLGIWTHYFDASQLEKRSYPKARFNLIPRTVASRRGRFVRLFEQKYLADLKRKRFCGGYAARSFWLLRDDILAILEDEGFLCETVEEPDHPSGPAIWIFARKTS
jgi:hypothetical protein